MGPGGNLRVDEGRLWSRLAAMAAHGATPKGGCNRQALTPEDGAGRALFAEWCRALDLTVSTDAIGNQFAWRDGAEDLAPVLFGSHLDTQPTGGKYDGVLGVLAGLEAMAAVAEAGIVTRRPLCLVNWTNEEGTRFQPGLLGASVFTGRMTIEAARAVRDAEGVSVAEALVALDLGAGAAPIPHPHAYFELHIEQGPVLEAAGEEIGVVTHVAAIAWREVRLTGRESHAGTTPMGARADALIGAARLIERVAEIAVAAGDGAVGTVGRLSVHPNSPNVIPGAVVFSVDFRAPEQAQVDAMVGALDRAVAEVASAAALDASVAALSGSPAVAFDPVCVGMVRDAAEALGRRHRDMVSGAGHDAIRLAEIGPAAMIFCPCEGGLSHNEAEAITPAWAKAGADVLLHAVLRAAA